MIEREIKQIINEKEYQELIKIAFKNSYKQITQINYYFDTKSMLLFKKGCTLRIREYDNSRELTLKVRRNIDTEKGIITSKEYNSSLADNLTETFDFARMSIEKFFSKEQEDALKTICDEFKFYFLGEMKTSRIKFKPLENLPEIEVDKNIYNGIIDYELEWELDKKKYYNEAKKWLKSILKKTSLVIPKNKFSRFVSTR